MTKLVSLTPRTPSGPRSLQSNCKEYRSKGDNMPPCHFRKPGIHQCLGTLGSAVPQLVNCKKLAINNERNAEGDAARHAKSAGDIANLAVD